MCHCAHPIRHNQQRQRARVMPTPIKNKQASRRASHAVRDSHLGRGSFLIEYDRPDEHIDAFRGRVPVGYEVPFFSPKKRDIMVEKYKTMARKGFRVTTDGCLIPEEQYCTRGGGATYKGHQRTFAYFANWLPSQEVEAGNVHGWPSIVQISHLCHRSGCCRMDHLLAEEQWKNLKRNYCGHDGQCDCGSEIKCLRRYESSTASNPMSFCETREQVHAALGGSGYKIFAPNHYDSRRDSSQRRKENQAKRARRSAIHAHETSKNALRLALSSQDDDDLKL